MSTLIANPSTLSYELIAQGRQGSQRAITQIFQCCEPKLRKAILKEFYSINGNAAADIDDYLQEGRFHFWQAMLDADIESFSPEKIESFCRARAVWRLKDFAKKHRFKGVVESVEEVEELLDEPCTPYHDDLFLKQIGKVLETYSLRDRELWGAYIRYGSLPFELSKRYGISMYHCRDIIRKIKRKIAEQCQQ